jgi:hypothetical protein
LGGSLNIIPGNESFTPNATTGAWDAVTGTLTINVNGTVTYNDLSTPYALVATRSYSGQLVMHAAVPEPSSLVLVASGLIALALVLRPRLRSLVASL